MDSIIVKLIGGLGNQMFQYALGRRLAHDLKVPLKLDTSFLEDRTPRSNATYRNYDLDIFELVAEFADKNDLKGIATIPPIHLIPRILYQVKRKLNKKHIIEPHFHFAKSILDSPKGVYLEGYFQSKKYFETCEEVIREDFKFKHPIDSIATDLADEIVDSNAVCIHVRRTDLVTNKKANKFHGVCKKEYFQQSIRYLEEKIDDPSFYIFSDDIKWCQENMVTSKKIKYLDNRFTGYKCSTYLQLMILCKHFIISNSTFSWWAVWFNQDQDKVVVAPKNWFADPSIITTDLIPETWIKL